MTWALSTGLFLWLGSLLDGRWHTEPIFTLLGALVGAVAGFYYMYHHLVTVPQREQKRRAEQRNEDTGETQP
jgi:F0F1-type ATP synthase assembly protein I